MTEHQKESLKRRKEDIAAFYNDLSQSSSQDTQNLQEWFDKKSKSLGEAEKDHNKKDNSVRNMLDDDANKENKIEMKELEAVSKSTAENDTKSTDNVEQNIPLESVQKAKDNAYSNENLLIEEDQIITVKNAYDNADPKTSADLDANTQEKSLENKDDKSLSPSMLDSSKRRSRYNVVVKPDTLSKLEEIVCNQPGQSNTNKILRSTLKTKLIQDKSEIINKQKASENVENKLTKEERRGVKRKSISDSESETTNARQRRKVLLTETASDSDRCKSVENDNAVTSVIAIDEANLSQRTRNEISRLRINMVFDSPLSRSRRSKCCDDKKQPEENKGGNIAKRETKHRGRSIRKVEENTKEETAETEVNSKGRSHIQNDMEDVVEDSQELSNKNKLSKIRIALNKIEDTKTILQKKEFIRRSKRSRGKEENVQTEIT